jgi:hypothetical protein
MIIKEKYADLFVITSSKATNHESRPMWNLGPKIWQTQSSKYLKIMILVNSKGLLRFMILHEGNEFRSAFLLLANFRQISVPEKYDFDI